MSRSLELELLNIVNSATCSVEVREKFVERINGGKLTIDENPRSHFVVALVPYDLVKKTVFIGRHKNTGLWLFSGGHIEKEEFLATTVRREIEEEWGNGFNFDNIGAPSFLTITPITKPGVRKCVEHYDIWYFIPIDSREFVPDKKCLNKEFYETGWKTLSQARELITTPTALEPITLIEDLLNK